MTRDMNVYLDDEGSERLGDDLQEIYLSRLARLQMHGIHDRAAQTLQVT